MHGRFLHTQRGCHLDNIKIFSAASLHFETLVLSRYRYVQCPPEGIKCEHDSKPPRKRLHITFESKLSVPIFHTSLKS